MWGWMRFSFHGNKKQVQQSWVSFAAGQEKIIAEATTKTLSLI